MIVRLATVDNGRCDLLKTFDGAKTFPRHEAFQNKWQPYPDTMKSVCSRKSIKMDALPTSARDKKELKENLYFEELKKNLYFEICC